MCGPRLLATEVSQTVKSGAGVVNPFMVAPVKGGECRLTTSTFSCDIAYSDSPAASRASADTVKVCMRTILPRSN